MFKKDGTSGVIVLTHEQSTALLDNCVFRHNFVSASFSPMGGSVIYIRSLLKESMIVKNCIFYNNSAVGFRGGVITIDGQNNNNSVKIYNTDFILSKAKIGGAIYSSSTKFYPQLSNVRFINNSATMYGTDIATYFKEVRILSVLYGNATSDTRPKELVMYSGDSIPLMTVGTYDGYNQRLPAQITDELFGIITITRNGRADTLNGTTLGGIRSLIIEDTTFFKNIRVLATTSPPEFLSSAKDPNIPDAVAYNLSIVRVNNLGQLTTVWDSIPLYIKRCSQSDVRQQVQLLTDAFPRCIQSKVALA
jgi:hypothetical protein